jgi:ADP-heptose:LPS heptosyltransferase
VVHRTEWIDANPPPIHAPTIIDLVRQLRRQNLSEACIFTSSHQSALPLALLLRLAGVQRITAISHDYSGSLLDRRIPGDPDLHEVERNLRVVEEAGYQLPPGDAAELRVLHDSSPQERNYVVVHPGASVPARTLAPLQWQEVVEHLATSGRRVIVTGSEQERQLALTVAGEHAKARTGGGLAQLASLLAGADSVVVGNTGPAHLAAAVGTPVVAVFPPTVPAARWRPWGVPSVLLGDQSLDCAGCRSRSCPLPEQACISRLGPDDVLMALESLVPARTSR